MEEKDKLLSMVHNGIIGDSDTTNFTITALLHADDEFWVSPCSSSGKYHPPEDQGIGGLARHVQKGVVVVMCIARRDMFEKYEQDCALAAYILHDIKKNGEPWGDNTQYNHGKTASEWLEQFYLEPLRKKMILDAVRYHMAPWNSTLPNDKYSLIFSKDSSNHFSAKEFAEELEEQKRGLFPNKIEQAVQWADYFASREGMSFLPDKTIVPDPRQDGKHDSPEEWARKLVAPYGLTLKER
jgi:hypothetical protein